MDTMRVSDPDGRVKVTASVTRAIHASVERVAVAERRSRSSAVEVLLAEALERRGMAAECVQEPRTGPDPVDDTCQRLGAALSGTQAEASRS